MNVNDVAEALRVSPHTVRRLVAQKKLLAVRVGTRLLFEPQAVAGFVKSAAAASTHSNPKEIQ